MFLWHTWQGNYYGFARLRNVCEAYNLDLVLPRVMADDKVSVQELASLGEGGLCLNR